MKVIRYYTKSVYGTPTEYIHPDDKFEAAAVAHLTSKKTINHTTRRLISELSGNYIQFQEVLAPK